MRVVITVKGRFHAFQLAGQLARRGHLSRLVTSYPRFAAARFDVPTEKVRSVLSCELLSRGANRLPTSWFRRINAQARLDRQFEERAAQRLPGRFDLLVAWSGTALTSIRRAHEAGAIAVLERGSSHILEQDRLLREEAERFGAATEIPTDVIERELLEYAAADYIAVPSGFAAESFMARGVPAEKLLRLPYGVDLDGFEPGPPRRDGPFRIVHCGAISAQKGCHDLLDAFERFTATDAELWLIGRVAPELEARLAAIDDPRVRTFGHVPGRDLPHLYRQCDLFCLASIQEGMALVLLQAMACGLPVVATVNSGAADLVRGGREGYVTPIRDPDALLSRFETLYRERDCTRAMGDAARRRVVHGYSWDDYGERVTRAYRDVLAREGATT